MQRSWRADLFFGFCACFGRGMLTEAEAFTLCIFTRESHSESKLSQLNGNSLFILFCELQHWQRWQR